MFDFYRFAAAVPEVRTADVAFQQQEMMRFYAAAEEKNASLILFPELSLTGCSCGELFFQDTLLRSAREAMQKFAAKTRKTIAVFGLPFLCGNRLYDLFAVAQEGKIIAFFPAPDPDERFFSPFPENENNIDGIPAGKNLILSGDFRFSCAGIGETAPAEAEIVLIPGKEAELPGRSAWRRTLLSAATADGQTVIMTAQSGWGESTSETVPSGQALIAANGTVRAEIPPLHQQGEIIFADVDLGALRFRRRKTKKQEKFSASENTLRFSPVPEISHIDFSFLSPHPFLPDNQSQEKFCRETLSIQAAGVTRRIQCCRCEKAILGISGGLDSTLALLVLRRACQLLGWTNDHILAVTMPGFGTTGRTRNNALKLAELIGCEIREISIEAACRQHFSDLQHDEKIHNSTYENSQARERTQILMDLANEVNGIVIGTGDLSEIALGWCTYNGDQMSMYAVNAGIPKSIIPVLMRWEAKLFPEAERILQDVIDTPVSPELLPADENGTISQKTETILGAYELHDFYLYHAFVNGCPPEKIFAMAKSLFSASYTEKEIRRTMELFFRRFFSQQFKRSASPDGAQSGPLSFSPRSSFLMPSDISGILWKWK